MRYAALAMKRSLASVAVLACIIAFIVASSTANASAQSAAPGSATQDANGSTLWWCTGVGTKDGGSFESQCFITYIDCLDYRAQIMEHEALDISQCTSQPRAWVIDIPGVRGGPGGAVYEARQTKRECQTYRRALKAAPGARHLRISTCRVRRPVQVKGRNTATLRMQRAAAAAQANLPAP